jgi:hypothetical protein
MKIIFGGFQSTSLSNMLSSFLWKKGLTQYIPPLYSFFRKYNPMFCVKPDGNGMITPSSTYGIIDSHLKKF